MSESTDREYFEKQYANDPDPWGFDSLWYERRKYELTMAALPRERYRRAFEPGCANGALSERLAERCDEVLSLELMDAPAERAERRLAGHGHVEVIRGRIPQDWPAGTGDLVVLSEVAYYLSNDELAALAQRLEQWLELGGHLVAVHYRGPTNYPQTGKAIGKWLDRLAILERCVTLDDDRFALGVWERVAP